MCTGWTIQNVVSKQDCLGEYARYFFEGEPLFRTVGFDFTFYGPPTASQLAHYASLLPTGFKTCAKVWEEITVPVYTSRDCGYTQQSRHQSSLPGCAVFS